MATYTTNLGLKKPAQSDKIRIADINNNMDDIDAAFGAVGNTSVATQLGDIRGGMAIVSNGNAHDAIAAGQFVYVMGHDTLDDGLYTANSALAANATLSSSNVTAVSGGGLNALNSKIVPSQSTLQVQNNEEFTSGQITFRKVCGNIYHVHVNQAQFAHTNSYRTVGHTPNSLNFYDCDILVTEGGNANTVVGHVMINDTYMYCNVSSAAKLYGVGYAVMK